ncbi:hypothetical protein bsdE14_04920 [Clostridium omnivorum]|uniref:Uncharacterized protein n=1 Tax=Clostridium omnivorum TaxID=1604902 RepID=A0ABQ5N1L5_9CLOT|nr:hypothetical protein bsdE14_04920 [Clostridium sp. E14]
MKKLNNYICLGLLFNSIFLFSNEFKLFPEFIKGLFAGLGIALILIGVYSERHDLSRLRNYKKSLFNRLLSK